MHLWTQATPGSNRLLTTCEGGSSSVPHSKRSGSMPTLTDGESRSSSTTLVVVTTVDVLVVAVTRTTGAATVLLVLILRAHRTFALR